MASTNGRMAEWVIDADKLNTDMLKPNDSVYLRLNVETELRSGPTDLHLYYRHIPGYWDGSRACTIQKSPLIFHHVGTDRNYVGIGTNKPASKLAVTDGLPSAANGQVNIGRHRAGFWLKETWVLACPALKQASTSSQTPPVSIYSRLNGKDFGLNRPFGRRKLIN